MPKVLHRVTAERKKHLTRKRQQAFRDKRASKLAKLKKLFEDSTKSGFPLRDLKQLRRQIVALEKLIGPSSSRSTTPSDSSGPDDFHDEPDSTEVADQPEEIEGLDSNVRFQGFKFSYNGF